MLFPFRGVGKCSWWDSSVKSTVGGAGSVAKVAAKGSRSSRGSKAEKSELLTRTSGLVSEAAGIFLVGSAALAALALATYSPEDPAFSWPLATNVVNQAGPLGASLAFGLFWLMGMGSLVFVAALGFLGGPCCQLMKKKK